MMALRSPKGALIAFVGICALAVGVIHVAVISKEKADTASAKRHMAVTANPLASEAAREILRQGGSAVDAAIAAQLVLTLVEPQSSGIGGGLFLIASDAKGNMRTYDGREAAPASVTPGMFLSKDGKPRTFDDAATGGLAVGVPGAIAALELAHRRYGKLPWAKLFDPAIRLAESGFEVSRLVAHAIEELDPATLGPDMRNFYFRPDGAPLPTGYRLRDPQFAITLRHIAANGSAGFYEGPIAEAIVAAVRKARRNPGGMQLADLRSYQAKESAPVCGPYRAFKVCTVDAPSGGVTVLQILGMLRWAPSEVLKPGTLSRVHYTTQASRLAYADRAQWLGDPAVVPVPTAGLLDAPYLVSRGQMINPSRDMGEAIAGSPRNPAKVMYAPHRTPVYHGTSHLSVVDGEGNVASMTMSIQASFGAQIRVAGFVLNNELTDFSWEAERDGLPIANAPAPGKRPLSAMSPSIVFDKDGKFFAAIGSPGGRDIIAYNAQALSALIDGGVSISQAVSEAHFTNLNSETVLEASTSLIWLAPQLMLSGHRVRFRALDSGLNGIRKVAGGYQGASDVRGEGAAVGD